MKQYILFVLIAIDQMVNALRGGYPDETLSSAAWRGEQDGKILGSFFRPIIDWMFSGLESNHCCASYESESTRAQLPGVFTRDP